MKSASSASGPLGSLRRQLLGWLLIPLTLLVALNAVFTYNNALEAADIAYDRSLLASTRALAEQVFIFEGRVEVDVPYVALDSFEADTRGRLYYKVSGIDGSFVSGYDDLPPLPKDVKRSPSYPALVYFYHATYQGEPIRIAALQQPVYDDRLRGIALIQVAESLEGRHELSRNILIDTLWRQVALVLAAAVLAWIAVSFVLRPLMRLRAEVEARAPIDLSDFDPLRVHREVRPLVAAMNGYMGRLQTLIAARRRFIADASHQLRTPLTVLKTQAELARRSEDPAAMREIVESIAQTTDSTVHLANRLLALARTEHGALEAELSLLSLSAAARQVGLELAQEAVAHGVDLSFEGDAAVRIDGNGLLLHEMIANLVDNAIRYTPHGGKVAIRVSGPQAPLLEVEDSGPGIPVEERQRVFAPFYRAGSAQAVNAGGLGLGLPIVRDIAVVHKASLHLEDGVGGNGLKVAVRFPAPADEVIQHLKDPVSATLPTRRDCAREKANRNA
jgi:two-component system sensor histidine kinase TctE